jgi:hypothetical protein
MTLPGAVLEVRRYWRKATFRVVWTGMFGSRSANHIGLFCLEPDKDFWHIS